MSPSRSWSWPWPGSIVPPGQGRRRADSSDRRQAYDAACRRVDAVVDRLAAADCDLEPFDINTEGPPRLAYRSNFTQEQFEAAVRKCVEYIRAGDIFQVVLSQRLEVPIRVHPFQIYRTLRVVNPSPFMFYLRTPSVTLVGSSPEIMVRVEGRPGHHAAPGRHPPPRSRPTKRTAAWPRSCWPIPRSGRST